MPTIEVDVAASRLRGVRWVGSPNFDARPDGVEADLIVVHGISLPPGSFGGPWIDCLFSNTLPAGEHPYFATASARKVSAHLLVRRDGELTQYVRFADRAWHAGRSSYLGRAECNDYSIGIELEGTDTTPYTDVQYRVLARIVAGLCKAYPQLTPERLTGHSDIAPGRKTDPGPAFDWPRARRLVGLACAGSPTRA